MLKPITTETAQRICCLVIGPAGIGKTSLIRTILGQGNDDGNGWKTLEGFTPEKVCVLSAESGLLCVRDLVSAGQVEGFEIGSITDFHEALRMCRTEEFKARGYQWLFIDSLTEIASRCAENLQEKYPSKTDSFKMWAEYSSTMTDIIKAFRDMDSCNVCFTCLQAYDKDEFNRRFPAPDIAGSSLKQRLTSYFDEVFVMDRVASSLDPNDPKPVLVFQTYEPVGLAKDRSGRLAPKERPNLLHIKRKILGS